MGDAAERLLRVGRSGGRQVTRIPLGTASARRSEPRATWRITAGERHRLGAEQRHAQLLTGFAGLRPRLPNKRLELLIAELDPVEFIVKHAHAGAQILLIDLRIKQ